MNLADVERALRAERDSHQLGVPVALRIHARLPEMDNDLLDVLGRFGPLISLLGDMNRGVIHAKRHSSGQQLTVLWTEDTGKTAILTLSTSPGMQPALHVLFIGNHGTAQLQGGEAWSDAMTGAAPRIWEKEIQESLRKGTSIRVNAS